MIQPCRLTILLLTACILAGGTYGNDYCFETEDSICHAEGRLYEKELDDLLRKILKEGFPSLNIGSLDPIQSKDNISLANILPEISGGMIIEKMMLEGIEVTGLSNFTNNLLTISLAPLGLAFNLSFEVAANTSNMDFKFIIGDLLPFFGDGATNLELGIDLVGNIVIGTNESHGSIIYIKDQSIDLVFGDLQMTVDNIMDAGGTREAVIFNKLLSEVTPEILNRFVGKLKDSIIEPLFADLNRELYKLELTFADLLACIRGEPSCKLNKP